MREISMTALTSALEDLGHQAIYVNSGGGCGTIYIGEADGAGMYEWAIGPSSFRDNIGNIDEMCVGIDGEDDATYLEGIIPQNVATFIDYVIRMKGRE